MPDHDPRHALAALAVLTTHFPGGSLSPETIELWAETLADIPARDLKAACRDLVRLRTSHWCPTPGEIRAVVDELVETNRHTPLEAWREIVTVRVLAAPQGEPRQLPAWVTYVVEEYALLPIRLSDLSTRELSFERRDFIEWYEHRAAEKRLEERRARVADTIAPQLPAPPREMLEGGVR